ncbi:MAG: GerAB/ArcD/ProY family transporter [Bacillota bacterium]
MKNLLPDKIDSRVLSIIIFFTIVEFELFTLGRNIIKITGRDSWLSILIGSIFVTLMAYLLVHLARRFPEHNYFQYINCAWGKILGIAIVIAYLIFWGFFLTLLFKDIAEVNHIFFLPRTPLLIPIFLIAIGVVWLVTYGLIPIIRFTQILSLFFIVPVLLIIPLSINNIETKHFFPILENGITPVLKGAVLYAGYFHGLELILFIFPFIRKTNNTYKHAILGVGIINLLALCINIIVVGVLGIDNTTKMLWPVTSMLSLIEVPGFPAERFELFLTVPLLITAFVTIAVTLYLLSYGIIQTFDLKNKKIVICSAALITVLATLLIPNFAWSIRLRDVHIYLTFIFIYFLPLSTLLLIFFRRKGGTLGEK